MTYSAVIGDSKCECSDAGCTMHTGKSDCIHKTTGVYFRVDMDDQTGTALCDGCANDAYETGLFATADEFEN